MKPALRVVKIGGSLLDMPGLPGALRSWLQRQPPALSVLLMGGGPLADVLRRADALHQLGEEASHWLCIRALGVTARLLAALLPEAPLLDDLAALRQWSAQAAAPGAAVFDIERFLHSEEPLLPPAPLAHCWAVTSDSLAARLAEALSADELVLLKSVDPPGQSIREWSEQGVVDFSLAPIAMRLRKVRCVNLRGEF